MNLGIGEIALLIVLALVLFGAKRLPEVGRAAGNAIREFKSAINDVMSPEKKPDTSQTSQMPDTSQTSEISRSEDKGDTNA